VLFCEKPILVFCVRLASAALACWFRDVEQALREAVRAWAQVWLQAVVPGHCVSRV
jgi:hypothetical protein